ncbi:MAG TPA: YceI family protein [Acidimicrobiales bacterium]|nr:YceI family protein [Acidimicrobiales bacterium]
MNTLNTTEIPGYVAGTWNIDPVHSDVSFTVRHMMVSKVRGHFEKFSGQIVTADDPFESTVVAVVDATSFNTNNVDRDNHIRSADFLEVDKYPTLEFRSTGLRARGGADYALDGELTVHGVTRPVTFLLELNGFTKDPYGGYRVGLSATTDITRSDFGVSINIPMEGGGVVVGDKVQVSLELEAVLDTPAS